MFKVKKYCFILLLGCVMSDLWAAQMLNASVVIEMFLVHDLTIFTENWPFIKEHLCTWLTHHYNITVYLVLQIVNEYQFSMAQWLAWLNG